jgi:hypothetical protein
MSATLNLNQFKLEFSDRVDLLLQERGSKLRDRVMIQMHTGSRAASPVNQVGSIEAVSPPGRFAPASRTDATTERRWVFPQDWESRQLLDRYDMLRYTQDFKGPYAENAALAIGRRMDDVIIAAAAGTANIGELGAGTEAFDTVNFRVAAAVGASAATGMNVDKLIEAREIFRRNNVDVDMERPCVVISPAQEADLLRQAQIVSTDFNNRPVLVDGRITQFMGFDFIVSNRTQLADVPFGLTATTHRRCFTFVKSGVHLGLWKDIETRVHERNELTSIPYEVMACSTFGATRIEQGKVIEILCAE